MPPVDEPQEPRGTDQQELQSSQNFGLRPSIAWPTNWPIHASTNTAAAIHSAFPEQRHGNNH